MFAVTEVVQSHHFVKTNTDKWDSIQRGVAEVPLLGTCPRG